MMNKKNDLCIKARGHFLYSFSIKFISEPRKERSLFYRNIWLATHVGINIFNVSKGIDY